MPTFTFQCMDCKWRVDTATMSYKRKCKQCKSARMSLVFDGFVDNDSTTAGYAGYNHGLDTVVQNKGHWKQLVKEQGLRPVG